MQSKRQIQKANTRNIIIETAYQVYSKHGFTATTAMIAKEAKLSHGSIFLHFPSVNELLVCLIENFGDKLALEMHRLQENNNNFEKLLYAYLEILSNYENFYIHLIRERGLLPEEVQLTLANIQSTIAYHFNSTVEQEIKRQNIKDLPVHMIFNTWLGLIHYYLLNKDLFSPGMPLLERYSSELVTYFMELVKK